MSDIAISVESLSKSYLIGHQAAQRERYTALRDVIAREARNFTRKGLDFLRGRQIVQGDQIEEFWALRDVNFDVMRGEVIGVIGSNGAGKSTLLKILSRITEPTIGRVRLRGRVASLLEVGTGFHPELSGRENIYLNGAILGMAQQEIRRKFDEIIDFAGVEKFLDTPVKRYSSGMYVRLAFAVAAHLEPEILIVDEVLSVGDAEFQKKCLGKMNDVARGGRTVLFVSHNMRAVQQLCGKALLLSGGTAKHFGDVDACIDAYLSSNTPTDNGYADLSDGVVRSGTGICKFKSFELLTVRGDRSSRFRFGEPFSVNIVVQSSKDLGEVLLGFSFVNKMGHEIMGTAAHDGGSASVIRKGRNTFSCKISPMILTPGGYSVRAAMFTNGALFDHIDEVLRFEVDATVVEGSATPKSHYVGDVYCPYEWSDSLC